MKILFLSHNPHEVHLEWVKSVDSRIKIIPFKSYNIIAKNYSFLRYIFPIVSLIYSFFIKVKENIILVDGGTSLYLASFLKMRNKRLRIIYLDADLFFYGWYSKKTLTKKIQSYLFFKQIDAVITVSEEIKKYSSEYLSVPIEIVAPYPKEIKKRKDIKRKNYGLYVGRIDPDKNIERIIKFALQCPHFEKFIIIGSGALDKYVRIQAEKNKKIIFLGYRKNVEKFYNKCKFLIHLPDSDPHSCTTMEAALGGCFPIISERVGSKYLFGDIFIVKDPDNFSEINKKINYIIKNESRAKKLLNKSIKKFPTKESSIKNFKKKFKKILTLLEKKYKNRLSSY